MSPALKSEQARSFESVSNCLICGSPLPDQATLTSVDGWRIVECRQCGSGTTTPRPSVDQIGCFYPSTYYAHTASTQSLVARIRDRTKAVLGGYPGTNYRTLLNFLFGPHILTRIPYMGEGKKLLDIGCGCGDTLVWAKKYGWNVYGIEPDAGGVDVARRRGLANVRTGTVNSAHYEDEFFDAVTMFQVLEHVHEPLPCIMEIKRILKPGGMLFIAVPNYASVPRVLFGEFWNGCQVPLHLTFFTPASAKALFERAGIAVVEQKTNSRTISVVGNLRSIMFSLRAWKRADPRFSILRALLEFVRNVKKFGRNISLGDQIFIVGQRPLK